jgi:O-succinylbenzoic acid--CoA ligase
MPDLVAIDLPGGEAFVTELRRAWDGGHAVLPVDQRLAPPARRQLLEQLRPARIVDASGITALAGGVEVEPGDALVMATSGSTGQPKGVILTHAAVAASARATSGRLGVVPGRHRWIACLPLNHIGGLSVVARSLLTGTACTVLPQFDADTVRALAGPDVLVSLVTTAWQRLAGAVFHTVVLGGSAAPALLPPGVVSTYGMTETGSGIVYDGQPLDGVEVDIDPARAEIRVRGPMLLRAYRDGTDPRDAAGWLATGDAGHWDPDGRLRVEGRLSELIISGGENVWPQAVEGILGRQPGVAEVAVGGRPDPDWGERVVAWVVPADPGSPPTLDRLRSAVREELAPFAAPRELVLVEALPKTALGKVRRRALL